MADNRSARGRIADHFLHTNEPGRPRLMVALAKAFHELAHEADVA